MGGLLSRLERYSLVIMDEVHERHVATDMLLGLLKLVALRRRDFRLVVMSACGRGGGICRVVLVNQIRVINRILSILSMNRI